VHFLLFVTVLRLYSAVTDRDAMFLARLSFAAILASAIFTVDPNFFFLFCRLPAVRGCTFLSLEIRRGASGAVFPPVQGEPSRERRFTGDVARGGEASRLAGLFRFHALFLLPAVQRRLFARTGFQPSLMTGFTDSVELGRIGEIKKDSSVVMRVKTGTSVNYPMLRWRGIALSTFDEDAGTRRKNGRSCTTRDKTAGFCWVPA